MDVEENYINLSRYVKKVFPETDMGRMEDDQFSWNDCEELCNGNIRDPGIISIIFLISVKKYRVFLKDFVSRIKWQKEYNKEFQEELNKKTEIVIHAASHLENVLPRVFQRNMRDMFRACLSEYIYKSNMLKRFYEKPRGYPGDYMMFEMLYDERSISDGIGYYFDRLILSYSFTRSIINRKNKMKYILKNETKTNGAAFLEIASIGCGSCREVKELLDESTFSKNIKFTFLDQDKEGLTYAREKIRFVSKNIKFLFLQRELMSMLRLRNRSRKFLIKKQDVIYSLGVVDYFLDNMFEQFVHSCYVALKPYGKLVIASCSQKNLEVFCALRWLSEWNFYYRSAEDVCNLLKKKIETRNIRIERIDGGEVFFIIIEKA